MKRYYIVGLTIAEAQGYSIGRREEHRHHSVRVLSVESVRYGALRGLRGDDVVVVILPRAWQHREATILAHAVDVLEQAGVKLVSPTEEDEEAAWQEAYADYKPRWMESIRGQSA